MANLWSLAHKLFGSSHDRHIKSIMPKIAEVNILESTIQTLSDDGLRQKTAEFKDRLDKGASLDSLLYEAFAVVREAAKRVLGMRPFDVQLLGGVVLHQHSIAQMRTGEGKTLMSTMPVYLNALEGKGVHVVTVNDYLAKRDSEHMGQIYSFLGLTTGVITNDMNSIARRAAYACDITYATNNELGFDYLRDNMSYELDQMVQRGHHYAIIDEVDSILVDEARTPLIISGPLEDRTDFYTLIDTFIIKLATADYEIDEKQKTAVFTELGTQKLEQLLLEAGHLKGDNLYDAENASIVHHINNALRAHKLFMRDKDYMVRANEIIIIDEFTGRMMPGRRYSEGLHQALEAKEHVAIQPESQTLASITFQNYFRMYKKLAGMTGTATTEAEEFSNIYNLEVIAIPTNLPVQRIDADDEIYRTAAEKYAAIIAEVKDAREKAQPILVGTTSIEKSEHLATLLRNAGIKDFQVLNARYHEQEAYIIAQAGVPGSITIATNMAGRGTDIQLGGNLEMRIEKELLQMPEGEERASKVTAIKKDIASLKEKAINAGGLYVLATERHESRRIDNQLRGRSGRQGDPGKSKFFLSLEDDLMRIFGSERMHGMLQKLGLKDGEAIIHPWINKAIEKAQSKVEARNFEIRKNLLKYDDVMNDQRRVIFEQRTEVLHSETLSDVIEEMREEVMQQLTTKYIKHGSYVEQWNITELKDELRESFALDLPIDHWVQEVDIDSEEIAKRIDRAAQDALLQNEHLHGEEIVRYFEKTVVIETIDTLWRQHLENLEHLRSVVGFRGYAQRDPLNEYKTEAFGLFQHLLTQLRYDAVSKLLRIDMTMQQPSPTIDISQLHGQHSSLEETLYTTSHNATSQKDSSATAGPPEDWGRIGRNEPCPCGGGKKYKHCHGAFI